MTALPPGIDGHRLDLAKEFFTQPFGAHTADLQALLDVMRAAPIEGKHFLLLTGPHTEWTLARMSRERPLTCEITDVVFHDLLDAERHVFALRWEVLFGEPLDAAEVQP